MKRGVFSITLSDNLAMFFIDTFNINRGYCENLHDFLYHNDEKRIYVFFII